MRVEVERVIEAPREAVFAPRIPFTERALARFLAVTFRVFLRRFERRGMS